MKIKNEIKKIMLITIFCLLATKSVNASEMKMPITYNNEMITYRSAEDFNSYLIFDNLREDLGVKKVLKLRNGLDEDGFKKVILCNQPSQLLNEQYVYDVSKNSDGTFSVLVSRKVEGDKFGQLMDKYGEIFKSLNINSSMSEYEKAKTIYSYIKSNIKVSNSNANAYDVLFNNAPANDEVLTVIFGNLADRANLINYPVCGLYKKSTHYFSYARMDDGYFYVVDIADNNFLKTNYTIYNTGKLKYFSKGNNTSYSAK